MGIESDIIALANANKVVCCLVGFAIIIFSIIFMIWPRKKKEGDKEEEEDMEEDNEPDTICAFQCNYNEEDEEWDCALFGGNSDRYCDKAKCPLWKG